MPSKPTWEGRPVDELDAREIRGALKMAMVLLAWQDSQLLTARRRATYCLMLAAIVGALAAEFVAWAL